MKKLANIILILSILLSTNVIADNLKKVEAIKLLNSMKMEQTLNASISQVLEFQLQQNPQLLPYKDVMLKYFAKYMSYESLKLDLVDIYSEAFTLQELRDINAFYQTPTGQKTIEKMPELMVKVLQLGPSLMQDNFFELQQMIADEEKRIQQIDDAYKAWEQVKKGMSFDEVESILGPPTSVSEDRSTTWNYPDFGRVSFINDKVRRIIKPIRTK